MKATNNSIGAMQDSDSLLLDKFNKLTNGMEDLTEQITLQQRQIRDLLGLLSSESLDRLHGHHLPFVRGQGPERSNTIECPPSNDEQVKNDRGRHGHDSDEVGDSDR